MYFWLSVAGPSWRSWCRHRKGPEGVLGSLPPLAPQKPASLPVYGRLFGYLTVALQPDPKVGPPPAFVT